jgi:poly-gamma-glutamate capsule biosynthesis protein CapA/YwtB (metallophosphatase superfamily)
VTAPTDETRRGQRRPARDAHDIASGDALTLFLCGDVMTGRGIDQILPHPVDPRLYEPWVTDAREYVGLAEWANGPVPRPVDFAYVWGDALAELDAAAPDLRIVNLETAVTRNDEPWLGKGINYRMHPENVACLAAARLDCCTLANNHVLDWGRAGLEETLDTLARAGIQTAGAGRDLFQAQAPAILDVPGKGRVLVFAFGVGDSGVPAAWAATNGRAGVALLEDLSADTVRQITDLIARYRRQRDLVVVSIHWGGNWGYAVPAAHRRFAHLLLDEAGVDVVHGHSSHHPKGLEVWQGKLVLYGCGDFLNDYEGIGGYEQFRGDLTTMVLATVATASGRLVRLELLPLQLRRLRLNRALPEDGRWLARTLATESARLSTQIDADDVGRMRWAG